MDLVMSHYVRMYVWGDGEQDWGDILGASESISSKVKGRIGVEGNSDRNWRHLSSTNLYWAFILCWISGPKAAKDLRKNKLSNNNNS